jgi:hypothetical protein
MSDNQSPLLHNKRHVIYPKNKSVITSSTFVDDINECQRLAKHDHEESNAKYFMKLRLKPGFTPFNIISYYILCFTVGVVLQFLTV